MVKPMTLDELLAEIVRWQAENKANAQGAMDEHDNASNEAERNAYLAEFHKHEELSRAYCMVASFIRDHRVALEAGCRRVLRFKADHVQHWISHRMGRTESEGTTHYKLIDKGGDDILDYCEPRVFCKNLAEALELPCEFIDVDEEETTDG